MRWMVEKTMQRGKKLRVRGNHALDFGDAQSNISILPVWRGRRGQQKIEAIAIDRQFPSSRLARPFARLHRRQQAIQRVLLALVKPLTLGAAIT